MSLKVLNIDSFYEAAGIKKNSFQNWTPSKGETGDAESVPSRKAVANRAHDLFRNSDTANSIVNTKVQSVVGIGIKCSPNINHNIVGITKTEAKELNKKISTYWEMWANSEGSTADRKTNFYGLQERLYYNYMLSGDVFAIVRANSNISKQKTFPFELTLQGIDADMVQNPTGEPDTNRLAGGIETNKYSEEIAYHFKKINQQDRLNNYNLYNNVETVRIPKYGNKSGKVNVIHFHTPVRFNERRGVSQLASIMESLKQLKRYKDSELMATVISSFFTVLVKTSEGGGLNLDEETNPVSGEKSAKLGSGNISNLRTDEDVEVVQSNRPNQNFMAFEEAIMCDIASSKGMSVEQVRKKYTTSYTAARAALMSAFHVTKIDREKFSFVFNQPVYEEFFTELLLKGIISAPGFFTDPIKREAYLNCDWIGDAMMVLDPIKEYTAANMAEKQQIKSNEQITKELTGKSYDDVLQTKRDERDEREALGMLLPEENSQETKRIEADAKKTTAENTAAQNDNVNNNSEGEDEA